MALLDPGSFEAIFLPFRSSHVGFLPMPGNVGDRMIDGGACRLFEHFGIRYRFLSWSPAGDPVDPGDEIAVSGGGNLGSLYPEPKAARLRALETGLRVTILPQTLTNLDEDLGRYHKVYVRERASLAMAPGLELGPDLALALEPPAALGGPSHPLGVFLRWDREGKFCGSPLSLGDPIELCRSVEEYLRLAARFRTVVTDRLHFAIAAMTVGRNAILLPGSYHKNRSMYETWLRDLGCGWREDLGGLRYDKTGAQADLYVWLAACRRRDRRERG